MPEFKVSTEELAVRNLSLTQYLILWGLYHEKKIKGLVVVDEAYENLEKRGFIKRNGEYYVLNEEGLKMFEEVANDEDLFEEFLSEFPTRVKDASGQSRTLSPDSSSSILGKKMKLKWRTLTKGKLEIQRHIINCLKAEVTMRKSTGALYWMRNIEAWLNKGTWQDYEYLLEQYPDTKTSNDTLRVGEIRL